MGDLAELERPRSGEAAERSYLAIGCVERCSYQFRAKSFVLSAESELPDDPISSIQLV
jgi:hypothetical protein